MSYNGSGTFQINTSGQPVVAGTVISSTAFNALTADLATGLSTAITKDGQTTATARIPFAQGISSTLTTDSSSVSTGSIITAGGAGIAKALYVGTTANVAGAVTLQSTLGVTGVATFSAAPIYSSLTASSAVATDASKALVSVTNTGTGNNVLATSPTLVTPVLGAASATSITVDAGAVGTPSITTTGDTNTGIFFPAADTIAFAEGGAEAMRIDSDGDVGIGTTAPADKLHVAFSIGGLGGIRVQNTNATGQAAVSYYNDSGTQKADIWWNNSGSTLNLRTLSTDPMIFSTNNAERCRIDSGGNLLVAKTATDLTVAGAEVLPAGRMYLTASGSDLMILNRLTNDGALVEFRQASTVEGTISVSGTTVSYNGGHLSRWAQTTAPKDDTLVKGTVLSNLDEMNVYTDADGNPVDNEQLNKVKVSDVDGDANVAGVFVNWTHDDAHNVDEINMAMTGDMIIRIAQGTTVQRGDLLMSAGDGTAKPQGDDIVRSKTVAKVTSTHVTCTYADGSYCVPCVLMAC
jgi:hypothetical protein